MTKAEIRRKYKSKRTEISFHEKDKLTDLILINFQRIELPFINYVHTYLAIEKQNEVDTKSLIGYLRFINPGLIITVPKINIESGEMHHYFFTEELELAINSFSIPEPVSGIKTEPKKIDLVLTPLLAFDERGYRVGYGKGFYDKFFKQCRNDVVKIGLSFFEAEHIINDVNQFDVPLNYCVTPNKVYSF